MVPEPQRERRAVGSYELVKPLAKGGMARLYLGRHSTGRLAAVKILLERFDQKAKLRRRFFNEARIISSIHHPNIVELYEFGQTESGSAYLVMEYLHGVTLETYLGRRDHVAVRASLGIAEQIASALAVVHSRGVVHRDLKPGNVMLVQAPGSGELVAKVLDFGIAKLLDSDPDTTEITKTGAILGTPKYMSPEQCRGDRNIDHRTDIYGLGIILYGLVTGSLPFGGKSSGELIGQHLHVPPRPPSAHQPRISTSLEHLVLRCLAKEPEDRFQSMDELATALRAEVAQTEPAASWPLSRARSSRAAASDSAGTPKPVSPVEGLDDTGETRQLATPLIPVTGEDSTAAASEPEPSSPVMMSSVELVEAPDPAMLPHGESARIRKGMGALWGALALVAVLIAALVLYEVGYLAARLPSADKAEAENRAAASGTEAAASVSDTAPSNEALLRGSDVVVEHPGEAEPISARAPSEHPEDAESGGQTGSMPEPGEDGRSAAEEAGRRDWPPEGAEPLSPASRASMDSRRHREAKTTRSRSSRRGKQRGRSTSSHSSSPEASGSHESTTRDDFEKPVF